MNLMVNAIDAIDERIDREMEAEKDITPGVIDIITTFLNNQVTVEISDNASGVPAHVQAHIFDPFFTTKPVGKGTGLGLAISYQIVVSNHDGELKCISTPGVGTRMVMKIPVMA
jgi:signal transduction histidine kinase